MSKVKLIIRKRNSLDFGEVTDVVLNLQKSDRVIGIVETDFEPEDDGSVRASDGLDPVVTIENINHLMGQVLTLVEASTIDPEQRKAAKDLYKQTVWGWYTGLNDGLSRAWRFDKGYESNEPRK
jgi:hypothetical protein